MRKIWNKYICFSPDQHVMMNTDKRTFYWKAILNKHATSYNKHRNYTSNHHT